jgi:mycofactocin precursor
MPDAPTDSKPIPAPPETAPARGEDAAEQEPLLEADLLIEDVSIDGMCGVY